MKDLMIDRQKAIKLAADYLYNLMSPRCIGLTPDHCWKEAEDMLAKVPSAEPERKWVLCSERLPEKSGMYIITDKHGNVNLVRFHATAPEFVKEYWRSQTEAWMPLPEPAKLEND